MKKRWLALFLAVVMFMTNLTTTTYANEDVMQEASMETDLIEWVTQTGGMTLAERAQISTFGVERTVADYEGAKEALLKGVLNWEKTIYLSQFNIPVEDASALYYEVCYENPQLFYLETGCRYSYGGNYLNSITPIYNTNFTKEDVSVYEATIEGILDCIPDGMSEEDTALALHDYLVAHCAYDTSYSRYDAYSALVEGSAVCQGYALAYTDLLNRCGIENEYVASDAMNHAWNLVNVDDEWYHVDATWDDPLMGGEDFLGRVGHDNFLRSDNGIMDTGHYSWVASNDCDSIKYDDYYWSYVESAIVFSDASTCYFMYDGVLIQNKDDNMEEMSDSAADRWYAWGASNSWYSGSYNSIVLNDNILYYNSADEVYVYNLLSGEESLYYTYEGGEGYIYGMAESVSGDVISLNIKTAPNKSTVDLVDIEIIQNEIEPPKPVAGWQKNDTGWWYSNGDGTYPKSCWKEISGKWYAFDERGYMREGWFKDGQTWYYLQPNSGSMVSGWQYINNTLYYFTSGGAMATGWQYVGDKFYYFTPGGALATGWQYIDNVFYYFTSEGKMVTGWTQLNGTWYYFNANGSMAIGWLNQNGTWYYLNPNGSMATGWVDRNGTWYYFYSNGAMAVDTWIGNYYVNSSGAWVR